MFKKILIINPFGIGDVLFTTPLIHSLKEEFPNLEISYLCNRRTSNLLKSNPYLKNLFIYERDEFELVRKKSLIKWFKKCNAFLKIIKDERFDLALDFSLNTQYSFLSWLAGIKSRVGYNFKKRGRFLTKKVKFKGYQNKHVIEYYADLLSRLGLNIRYKKPELFLSNQDIISADKILQAAGVDPEGLLIGVIPGAGGSWGPQAYIKHWPADNFARLTDKIIENYKATVIIMGDFSETRIAKRIKSISQQRIVDLVGRTTLGELAALFKRCKLIVTNDGGPLHMAVALGIKTVSIFGPVSEKVYGPYPISQSNLVVKNDIECRPCYRNFRMPDCKRQRQCLSSLSVEEVFAAVRRLL